VLVLILNYYMYYNDNKLCFSLFIWLTVNYLLVIYAKFTLIALYGQTSVHKEALFPYSI